MSNLHLRRKATQEENLQDRSAGVSGKFMSLHLDSISRNNMVVIFGRKTFKEAILDGPRNDKLLLLPPRFAAA